MIGSIIPIGDCGANQEMKDRSPQIRLAARRPQHFFRLFDELFRKIGDHAERLSSQSSDTNAGRFLRSRQGGSDRTASAQQGFVTCSIGMSFRATSALM